MSYPNFFSPRNWRSLDGDPEALKASIASGTLTQTSEVQGLWQDIADKMIEVADLFKDMVDGNVGITQVIMQADPELDEHEMYLNFRVRQTAHGASGPSIGPNNWAAISAKLIEISSVFAGMVGSDVGESQSDVVSDTTAGVMMVKLGLRQLPQADVPTGERASRHKKAPIRNRARGFPG